MKKDSIRNITVTAMFVALTIVLSQIAIPLPFTDVPLSLATLAVFLSGAVLGPARGAVAQGIYVVMGLAGLPVFANFSGGFARVLGPTGGYIWGYIVAALFIGLIISKAGRRFWAYPAAMVTGLAGCYALGTAWYMIYAQIDLWAALALCVVPFLVGDAIKIVLASVLAYRLRPMLNRMAASA